MKFLGDAVRTRGRGRIEHICAILRISMAAKMRGWARGAPAGS